MNLLIRHATEADLPALLAIYNDAVENTLAIWNETLVDLENRREWLKARNRDGFPVLVAERDGAVLGYAARFARSRASAIPPNFRSMWRAMPAAAASDAPFWPSLWRKRASARCMC